MRRATCVICMATMAWAVGACDKQPSGEKAPAAVEAEAAKPAPAKPEPAKPAAGDDEKQRFVVAFVAAACAVQQAEDMTKMVDLTRQAYEKHGFNQLSYAAARDKYANLPDVKKATEERIRQCAAAGDKPAEAKAPIPAWATPPATAVAEGAKAEEGEEAKEGEEKKEEAPAKAASPYAGTWTGNFTGGDGAGTLKIYVKADGSYKGNVIGKKPKAFTLGFSGKLTSGTIVMKAKTGGPDNMTLSGKLAKGVGKGAWRGMISKKAHKGTWRAAKK